MRSLSFRSVPAGIVTACLALALAGVAQAAPPPACQGTVTQQTLYENQGRLESLIVGNAGRMYVSGADTSQGEIAYLARIARPGAEPRRIATAGEGPGGLAWAGRQLVWGNGNNMANGQQGDDNPVATLFKVDAGTGVKTPFASGLGMANGVTAGPDGGYFASNDFGNKLDRISRNGTVQHGWASVESANGLVVSRNGKYLFANQTFAPVSSIVRISLADPTRIRTWFTREGEVPYQAVFDGLARDDAGSLYVAAWLRGEIWKIDANRRACVLASGLGNPSNVAFGRGKSGFRSGDLFTTSFGGQIVRIRGALGARVPG